MLCLFYFSRLPDAQRGRQLRRSSIRRKSPAFLPGFLTHFLPLHSKITGYFAMFLFAGASLRLGKEQRPAPALRQQWSRWPCNLS